MAGVVASDAARKTDAMKARICIGATPEIATVPSPPTGRLPPIRLVLDRTPSEGIARDEESAGGSEVRDGGLTGTMDRVLGVSWGTTLALAYAQTHPQRVSALVLALVTTTSRREVDWITRGVGCIFPRERQRFADAVPDSLRQMRLVDAYATLLFDPDHDVRERAAREWCAWEDSHISLAPGHLPNPRFDDADFRLRFARLVTHYWRHAAFLDDEQLLRDAPMLDGVPGVLIHGRYDVSSPLETAWRLSQRWSTSRLQLLDDAGRGGGDTFVGAVTGALRQLAVDVT